MKKMLKLTDEILELPFNDNIRYEEGDDVAKRTPDKIPNDPLNVALQLLYKEAPKLKTKSYKSKDFGNMTPYKTKIVFEECTLTRNFLESKKENLQVIPGDNSEEEAKTLSKEYYDGVNFFSNSQTIRIPSSILEYIEKYKSMEVCSASYNYDKNVKEFSVEKLPEKRVYSFFGEEKFGRITTAEGQWTYLCKDIPYKFYSKNINIDARTLAYDEENDTFYGHSGDNFAKMSHLCYDIAKNGLPIPVAALFNNNGTLTLYGSNKKQMLAQYLKCPTIPMIIISGPIGVSDYLLNYKPEGNVNELNELINPYFMII